MKRWILRAKKKGDTMLSRSILLSSCRNREKTGAFGVTFEQGRNELNIDEELPSNFVTKNKEVPEEALIDMKIALDHPEIYPVHLAVYVKGGQAIGIGAGQQSRIHCTRLAGQKADNWWLRQSPPGAWTAVCRRPWTRRQRQCYRCLQG